MNDAEARAALIATIAGALDNAKYQGEELSSAQTVEVVIKWIEDHYPAIMHDLIVWHKRPNGWDNASDEKR